ncbi:MAG: hypothetical protein ABIN91_20450 [Mucilaginibacter sp.]|uniref:hypothetical protein n=1 Tax=Mucilaginibacter sp. TaxID=1882438 RepID=UPI0032651DFA
MNETQSLPFGLQFTVALASIFSAAAVIIYIIQTIMNARNFNKQFKISEAQTKLAKDQLIYRKNRFVMLIKDGYQLNYNLFWQWHKPSLRLFMHQ